MRSSWHRYMRPLLDARAVCGWTLLLLAWGSAIPASADILVDESNSSAGSPYVINRTFTGSVFVEPGGFLNIEPGANIVGGFDGVDVRGGTVNMSGGRITGLGRIGLWVSPAGGTVNVTGGTIYGASTGLTVDGGTVNLSVCTISGGKYGAVVYGGAVYDFGSAISVDGFGSAIPGPAVGLAVQGGSASISGGSISSSDYGISFAYGTLRISGCDLQLTAAQFGTFQLTGTLQDGTPINTLTLGVTASNLIRTCPYSWSGVLQPINPDGTSVFNAGSTVLVRFQLTGTDAGVTNAAATLSYALVSASEPGAVNEAASTGAATTGSLFSYAGGQYIYNWSTKGLMPGTYQLQINLGDGVPRTVLLGLK